MHCVCVGTIEFHAEATALFLLYLNKPAGSVTGEQKKNLCRRKPQLGVSLFRGPLGQPSGCLH